MRLGWPLDSGTSQKSLPLALLICLLACIVLYTQRPSHSRLPLKRRFLEGAGIVAPRCVDKITLKRDGPGFLSLLTLSGDCLKRFFAENRDLASQLGHCLGADENALSNVRSWWGEDLQEPQCAQYAATVHGMSVSRVVKVGEDETGSMLVIILDHPGS